MCTGLEIASLALAAGGTAASAVGGIMSARDASRRQAQHQLAMMENDRNVQRAMNAERDATVRRTDQLDQEAQRVFSRTLEQQGPQEPQRQLAEDGRMAVYDRVQPQTTVSDIPLRGDAPAVVRQAMGQQLSSALGAARDEARARARLGSFVDTLAQGAIRTGQGATDIGLLRGFADREQALLNDRQTLAGAEVDRSGMIRPGNPSLVGPLLQAGGTLAARFAGRQPLPQLNFSSWFGGPQATGAPLNLLPGG